MGSNNYEIQCSVISVTDNKVILNKILHLQCRLNIVPRKHLFSTYSMYVGLVVACDSTEARP